MYMKMLYDKQEGCFKVLDTKRYAIVDMDNHTGSIYINHYKDGTIYTGASPFVNAECSCVEAFVKSDTSMKRLGLINYDSECLILYSTKKISKLKKAFESIAKHSNIDHIEVVYSEHSTVGLDSINGVVEHIKTLSSINDMGYIYIHLFSNGFRVSDVCLYKKGYQSIKFQTFKTVVSFDNKCVSDLFNLCIKFDKE